MSKSKQFVVEENEWKGKYWWAVVNTKRVEDCFECRNKEVALRLCDFLNKATDDLKWQIRRCEKWSAIVNQLKKENKQLKKAEKINMEYAEQIVEENHKLRIEKNDLRIENKKLKKEKEQLFRDLLETQGYYVRLVCFVRRLGLKGDDLARFEGELNE